MGKASRLIVVKMDKWTTELFDAFKHCFEVDLHAFVVSIRKNVSKGYCICENWKPKVQIAAFQPVKRGDIIGRFKWTMRTDK